MHEGELIQLTSGPTGGRNYANGWWEGKYGMRNLRRSAGKDLMDALITAGLDANGKKESE